MDNSNLNSNQPIGSFLFEFHCGMTAELIKQSPGMLENWAKFLQFCQNSLINNIFPKFIDNKHFLEFTSNQQIEPAIQSQITEYLTALDNKVSNSILQYTINGNSDEIEYLKKKLREQGIPFEISEKQNYQEGYQIAKPNISFKFNNEIVLNILEINSPNQIVLNDFEILLINIDKNLMHHDEFGYDLFQRNCIKQKIKQFKKERTKEQNQYYLTDYKVEDDEWKNGFLMLSCWNNEKEIGSNLDTLFLHLNYNMTTPRKERFCIGILIPTQIYDRSYIENILESLSNIKLEQNGLLTIPTTINLICGKNNVGNAVQIFEQTIKTMKTKYSQNKIKIEWNSSFLDELKPIMKIPQACSETSQKIWNDIQTRKRTEIREELKEPLLFTENLKNYKVQSFKNQWNVDFKCSSNEIVLQGFSKTMKKMRNQFISEILSISIPNTTIENSKSNRSTNYEFPPNWSRMGSSQEEFSISSNSQEWQEIAKLFKQTVSDTQIVKITRIQNTDLWQNYAMKRKQIEKKGTLHEMFLFHGTSQTDPALIYKGKECGFDMRLAKEGLWGKGTYFSSTASYSQKSYGQREKNGNSLMILARVIIGKPFPSSKNNSLKRPPPIEEKNPSVLFDSVQGNSQDSQNIFVIQDNNQAQPEYILEQGENNTSKVNCIELLGTIRTTSQPISIQQVNVSNTNVTPSIINSALPFPNITSPSMQNNLLLPNQNQGTLSIQNQNAWNTAQINPTVLQTNSALYPSTQNNMVLNQNFGTLPPIQNQSTLNTVFDPSVLNTGQVPNLISYLSIQSNMALNQGTFPLNQNLPTQWQSTKI